MYFKRLLFDPPPIPEDSLIIGRTSSSSGGSVQSNAVLGSFSIGAEDDVSGVLSGVDVPRVRVQAAEGDESERDLGLGVTVTGIEDEVGGGEGEGEGRMAGEVTALLGSIQWDEATSSASAAATTITGLGVPSSSGITSDPTASSLAGPGRPRAPSSSSSISTPRPHHSHNHPQPPRNSPSPRSTSPASSFNTAKQSNERHVMVCTDSSPPSIDALEFTFQHLIRAPPTTEAKPDHLTCLCVLREPMLTADEVASGMTLQQVQRSIEKRYIGGLKRLLSSLRDEYRIRVRMTIKIAWADEPRNAIVDVAALLKPNMLVMGTRGLTGTVTGSFLGSVSGYLLHKCPVPIVVARTSTKAKAKEELERLKERVAADQSRMEEELVIDDFVSKSSSRQDGFGESGQTGWEASLISLGFRERAAANGGPDGTGRPVLPGSQELVPLLPTQTTGHLQASRSVSASFTQQQDLPRGGSGTLPRASSGSLIPSFMMSRSVPASAYSQQQQQPSSFPPRSSSGFLSVVSSNNSSTPSHHASGNLPIPSTLPRTPSGTLTAYSSAINPADVLRAPSGDMSILEDAQAPDRRTHYANVDPNHVGDGSATQPAGQSGQQQQGQQEHKEKGKKKRSGFLGLFRG